MTSEAAPTTATSEAASTVEATAAAAPKPHSLDQMLNKAENDPTLKYCTMDGLFCIPRNYSK